MIAKGKECLLLAPMEAKILLYWGSVQEITSSVRYRSCVVNSGTNASRKYL